MSKRFTETEKWRDGWFRKLSPARKCLWTYIVDNCDQAGVIDIDWELASFQIGAKVSEGDLAAFDRQILRLDSGKLWVSSFVKFQYGKLSVDCKPHNSVFAALNKHGIDPNEVMQNKPMSNAVNPGLRARIIARDGLVCAYFNFEISEEEVEIDHVIPRAKGGLTHPCNLVVASKTANGRKGIKSFASFCASENLDAAQVKARILSRVSIEIEGFKYPAGIGYLGTLQDKDTDKDKDMEKDNALGGAASPLSDADWLKSLAADPAYIGIDVAIEHAKASRWCETNRKQLSRRRFVNWLNRAERPIGSAKPQGEFANAW